MLDGLVSGAVFAHEDRIVGEDKSGAQLHQRRQPQRRAHVIAEHHEGAGKGQQAAVEGHAVGNGGHGVLADAEVNVRAGEIARGNEAGVREGGVVGAGQIGGAADQQTGRGGGNALQHRAGVLAGGVAARCRIAELRGEIAGHAARARGLPALGGLGLRALPICKPRIALCALRRLGADALCQIFAHFLCHEEAPGFRQLQIAPGLRREFFAQRSAVGAGLAGPGAGAANLGAQRNQRRPRRFGPRRAQRRIESRHILAIGALHMPALRRKALGHIFAEALRRGAVNGNAVVVIEDDEVAQPQVPGQRGALVTDAFHQVAIAGDGVNPMAARPAAAGKARPHRLAGQRHADGVAEALPQRAGGHLDAGSLAEFRVPRRPRAELAKVLNLVQRQAVAEEMQQRVEQHGSVARREHEAVAQRPAGLSGIEAQVLIPELKHRARQPQRRAEVADARRLHRIHGEAANGVLDLPARCFAKFCRHLSFSSTLPRGAGLLVGVVGFEPTTRIPQRSGSGH